MQREKSTRMSNRAPINVIAAVSYPQRIIGRDNNLIWRLPEDMRYFKEQTNGGAAMMGRTTWDSIPDKFKPLAGRTNIVLTNRPLDVPEGKPEDHYKDVLTAQAANKEELIKLMLRLSVHSPVPLWICGGVSLYEAAIEIADTMHITWVAESLLDKQLTHVVEEKLTSITHHHIRIPLLGTERFFPPVDYDLWSGHPNSLLNTTICSFMTYKRKRPLILCQEHVPTEPLC